MKLTDEQIVKLIADAFRVGRNEGMEVGARDGYENGLRDGHDEGYTEGYDAGWVSGVLCGEDAAEKDDGVCRCPQCTGIDEDDEEEDQDGPEFEITLDEDDDEEELYQKAIHKYTQHAADNYVNGGDEYIYSANKFDNELFGVSSKRAQRDFDVLFPHYVKGLQGLDQDVTEDYSCKCLQCTNQREYDMGWEDGYNTEAGVDPDMKDSKAYMQGFLNGRDDREDNEGAV